MRIHGACHCGNIAFDLAWPGGVAVTPRECACAFCRKHGAAWTGHPDAAVDVRVGDDASVSRYRFGTRTADFHVCAQCGAVPVCTSLVDGKTYAVVNVRLFEGDVALAEPAAVDFDGEEEGDRLARRARNWISRVAVHDE
ncbi:hypothetical protein VI08_01500 [Luteibacter yeojuensis]|uniref:CENP-V/GFA domain-containing protein n=2 Tax=Luteibacter yeojuensis TaxID=345309 RepID=A0A0F3L3H5_9GAMM|nr:hypothetical protein VI08_01500 [Luteibacter yeojuensis]